MKNKFLNTLLLGLFPLTALVASHPSSNIETYLEWQKEHSAAFGPCADHKKGEIEICLDPEEIQTIQNIQYERLLPKMGQTDAFMASRIGIVAQDQFWIWLRDPVIFPSKAKGTYNRLFWKNQQNGINGVIVLAQLEDGRLVLNANYRHATRSWELELPRGLCNKGENLEETAHRELKEETGCLVKEVLFLGNVAPDTGVLATIASAFYGKVTIQTEAENEFSEAIEGKILLSPRQLEEAFEKGYLDLTIRGESRRVFCRDALTAYAFLQASLKGILEKK